MTAPGFTAHGKQVLALGAHYADAADTKAAEFIAEACNAKAKGGWQPIETAPRDGTEIDCWCAVADSLPLRITDCAWKHLADGPDWYSRGDGGWWSLGSVRIKPTHWMPLPSAPVQS